jgi:hypothetical protein
VEVLELVHRRKLYNVQSVGQNTIWLALQKVLALVRRNVGNRGENIARMCGRTLNAVSVVNSTLSSFRIHIEPLQIVVEINRTSAKVTSQESSVRSEDRGNVDPSLAAERQSDTGEPLVEMRDDSLRRLMADELN